MGANTDKIRIRNGQELAENLGYSNFDSLYRRYKDWKEKQGVDLSPLLKSGAVGSDTLIFLCEKRERDPSEFELVEAQNTEGGKKQTTAAPRPPTVDYSGTIAELSDVKLKLAAMTDNRDKLDGKLSTATEKAKAAERALADKNGEIERLNTANRIAISTEQQKTREAERKAEAKLQEQKTELTGNTKSLLASEKEKQELLEKNAYAQAEADFLKSSEVRIQAIAAQRIAVVTKKHDADMQKMKSEHGFTVAQKDGEIVELKAKIDTLKKVIAGLEKRLKTEWGLWSMPTKLEWINIVVNIMALFGFWFIHPFFGPVVWSFFALFYWVTAETVKDAQSVEAAKFGFNVTVGIEVLYGIIHISTIHKIVKGNTDLIAGGGENVENWYSIVGAIILSAMAIFALKMTRKKALDSIA